MGVLVLIVLCLVVLKLWGDLREVRTEISRLSSALDDLGDLAAAAQSLRPGTPEQAPVVPRMPSNSDSLPQRDATAAHRTDTASSTRAGMRTRASSAQVLAAVGGLLVLIAVVYFLGIAIARGWLTPLTQVVLAYIAGGIVVEVGRRRFHREVATGATGDAPLIVLGTGFGVLHLANVVATAVHGILSSTSGVMVAMVTAAATVVMAVRTSSQGLAGFGIVVGLGAPLLVGAQPTLVTLALIGAALVAAVNLAVIRGWPWLIGISMLVTAPQLAAWVGDRATMLEPRGELDLTVFAVLAGWWLVVVAGTGSWLLRDKGSQRAAAGMLSLVSAALVATGLGANYIQTQQPEAQSALASWLGIMGIFHMLGAIELVRSGWDSARQFGLSMGLLGSLHWAGAAVAQLDGVLLVAAIATLSILGILAGASLREQLPAAAGIVYWVGAAWLVVSDLAPPEALLYGLSERLDPALGIAIVAVSALLASVALRIHDLPERARVAVVCAGGAMYYGLSLLVVEAFSGDGGRVAVSVTSQVPLSAFWAATGFGLLAAGLSYRNSAIRKGGIWLLGIAAAKVLLVDTAELENLERVASLLGVGIAFIAGSLLYGRLKDGSSR